MNTTDKHSPARRVIANATIPPALAFAFLFLIAAAPQASATIIYNNLGQSSAGTGLIGNLGPLGDSFSNVATAMSLTDVQLLLEDTTPSDSGSFTVTLNSDSSTRPGSLIATLGTFADSLLTSSLATFDIPVSPTALAANTRYWIMVSQTSGSARWSDAYNGGVGTSGEYEYAIGVVFPNGPITPFQMEVTVSATPEPASWMFLIVVGIGAFALKRRYLRVTAGAKL